jgi:hypothetical protein
VYSEPECASGVRQGDIISPLKFTPWADVLLTWLNQAPTDVELGGAAVHSVFFANDMWLVNSGHHLLQEQVDRVSVFLRYFGVHINAKKSVYSTDEEGFDPGGTTAATNCTTPIAFFPTCTMPFCLLASAVPGMRAYGSVYPSSPPSFACVLSPGYA